MTKQLSRREFLKGVGLMMGAVAASGVATAQLPNLNVPRMDENGLTVRRRSKYAYPWWVKEVDDITTPLDPNLHKQPSNFHYAAYAMTQTPEEEWNGRNDKAKAYIKDGIVNNIPGRTLPDLALNYAETMGFGGIGSFDAPRSIAVPGADEIATYNLHPPQDFGLGPWQASPEKASMVVEQAGIQLGAAAVRFTELKPEYLRDNIVIDPSAQTYSVVDGKRIIPERYKYVAMFVVQAPRDLTIRSQSMLGATGDRAGFARAALVVERLKRFISGLGYGSLPMLSLGPVIAHAVYAGLGELGRMNRMINPLFGGNIRIDGILTDLPLASDRPIDFGLQNFCKTCKICAASCPAGALSLANEPTWDTFNPYQNPGKKAYFEDNEACFNYSQEKGNFCGTCMAVCPWSKQDKTALHDIAKTMAARTPLAGSLLTQMDQAFGYGLVKLDSPEMADWWDLDIPELGIDGYQGKS